MPPSKRPSYLEKYQNGQQPSPPKQYTPNGRPPSRQPPHQQRPSMLSTQQTQQIPTTQQRVPQHQQTSPHQRPSPGVNGTAPNRPIDARTSNAPTRKRQSMAPQRTSSSIPPSYGSRPASQSDARPIRIFDVFFDLPHPGASPSAERARMVKPPEACDQALLSELYEPSAVSILARFAFPDFDEYQHALDQQSKAGSYPRYMRAHMQSTMSLLNKGDVYVVAFRPERHTFSLLLRDGVTKLYGHALQYLPRHESAKMRSDVGRRGARAMVVLTRATGGDRFYTSVLRSLESVLIQGDSLSHKSSSDDLAREKVTRLLHGLHRQQVHKYSEAMVRLQQQQQRDASTNDADQTIEIPGVEIDVKPGGFIKHRWLPGDFIRLEIPCSLQAGFRHGITPDNIDAPVLPLLRCIGAANMIRILTALMCERKVIFVSENVTRLSTCVRAAASMLAQGQLSWRYNFVPILPPHLQSCLSVEEPYVIGLVNNVMKKVELLKKLSGVLCIHLDRNQFKTFGIDNPSLAIPDIMTKSGKETVAQILFHDMQQVLNEEIKIWGVSNEGIDASEPSIRKKKFAKPEKADIDMAALFNRVMRGDALGTNIDTESTNSSVLSEGDFGRLEGNSGHLPQIGEARRVDTGSLNIFDVCENSRCEDGLRAALTFFFLAVFGDIGALLTLGSNGAFVLDRTKYLLHQKKRKIKESSPLFLFYKAFSGTAMIEHHLSQRIDELETGKSLSVPHHRSLFSICEKHLRMNRLEFNNTEIRTVVTQASARSHIHAQIGKSELARARALSLTDSQPYEGNLVEGITSLIQDCHECDTILPQVMAVIWSRLEERKSSFWKHPLLGLGCLKCLLIKGPITVISYALDRIDRIRRLRFYDYARNEDNNNEVRKSAQIVWELLIDGSRLFLQRRLFLANRLKLMDSKVNQQLGSPSLKKLPFETPFHRYHRLCTPTTSTRPDHFSGVSNDGRAVKGRETTRMSLVSGDGAPVSSRRPGVPIESNRFHNSGSGSTSDNAKGSGYDARRTRPPMEGLEADRRSSGADPTRQNSATLKIQGPPRSAVVLEHSQGSGNATSRPSNPRGNRRLSSADQIQDQSRIRVTSQTSKPQPPADQKRVSVISQTSKQHRPAVISENAQDRGNVARPPQRPPQTSTGNSGQVPNQKRSSLVSQVQGPQGREAVLGSSQVTGNGVRPSHMSRQGAERRTSSAGQLPAMRRATTPSPMPGPQHPENKNERRPRGPPPSSMGSIPLGKPVQRNGVYSPP